MCDKISVITNSKCMSKQSGNIKNENRNLLFDQQQILSKLIRYIQKNLCDSENGLIMPSFEAAAEKIIKRRIRKSNKVSGRRKSNWNR